ncbi:hypothetical protein N9B94_01930 [Verrucomicrobia bacterium]|nr:hypothetical protein [Verrucomicrobiota bacterium]
MKTKIALLIVALAAMPLVSTAEPFNRERIPTETKWLVHLDVEGLLNTRIGEFATHILEREMKSEIEKIQSGFGHGIEISTDSLRSVSAFGNGYELTPDTGGVLVLDLEEKLKMIATGLLVQQSLAGADDDKAPVRTIENEDYSLYSIMGEVFVSLDDQNLVFVSKSREEMEEARNIWSGKEQGMGAANSFGNLTGTEEAFFFLAVAEDFNKSLPIPPQANFLKLADSARIMIGESSDDLFAALSLDTQDKKGATQMQQILQGLLAIAPLVAPQDPAVQNLLSGTSLNNENGKVSLSLRYSVEDAIQAFEKFEESKQARKKKKSKKKPNNQTPSEKTQNDKTTPDA